MRVGHAARQQGDIVNPQGARSAETIAAGVWRRSPRAPAASANAVALARGAVTVREVDEPLVQLGGRLLAQRRLAGAPDELELEDAVLARADLVLVVGHRVEAVVDEEALGVRPLGRHLSHVPQQPDRRATLEVVLEREVALLELLRARLPPAAQQVVPARAGVPQLVAVVLVVLVPARRDERRRDRLLAVLGRPVVDARQPLAVHLQVEVIGAPSPVC
mmetsp:Transcript_12372/g.36468  ORF Transcript_12372/g.36468 Transcript_12372/m.36468 type:complete len:219 (-) Transcript_12372:26-682(-)